MPRSEECCFGSDGDAGMFCAAAEEQTDPCAEGTDIYCDEPSDCPEGVCYLCLDAGNDILGTACATGSCQGQTDRALRAGGGTCAQGQQCTALDVKPETTVPKPGSTAASSRRTLR